MRRTEEQWDSLANRILRGEVDLAVLNDNTDVSGMTEELSSLREENQRLREALVGARNAMGEAAERKNDMARLFAEHIYAVKEALK